MMGWPDREAVIKSLASAGKIANVELLGFKGKLQWSQDETGLKVAMPAEKTLRPRDCAEDRSGVVRGAGRLSVE